MPMAMTILRGFVRRYRRPPQGRRPPRLPAEDRRCDRRRDPPRRNSFPRFCAVTPLPLAELGSNPRSMHATATANVTSRWRRFRIERHETTPETNEVRIRRAVDETVVGTIQCPVLIVLRALLRSFADGVRRFDAQHLSECCWSNELLSGHQR